MGECAKLLGNVCGKDQSEDQGDKHRGMGNGGEGLVTGGQCSPGQTLQVVPVVCLVFSLKSAPGCCLCPLTLRCAHKSLYPASRHGLDRSSAESPACVQTHGWSQRAAKRGPGSSHGAGCPWGPRHVQGHMGVGQGGRCGAGPPAHTSLEQLEGREEILMSQKPRIHVPLAAPL